MKLLLTLLLLLHTATALADDGGVVGAVAGVVAEAMDVSGGDDDD
jgi:hypothetical protein